MNKKEEELEDNLLTELLDTNTNFCVVCNGTFKDFVELKRFLKEKGVTIIYQTASQDKIFIVKGEKPHGKE